MLEFQAWKAEALLKGQVGFNDDFVKWYGQYCVKEPESMNPMDAIYLVVDTETTGLKISEGHKVCQLAGVWMHQGRIIDTYETLVDPGRHIPSDASAIHHITDAHVAGAPRFMDAFASMLAHRPMDAFAAHNAAFDFMFLPSMDRPVLCTLRLAKHLWVSEHYTNQFLRYDLPLEVPEAEGMPAHSALPDALVTTKLLIRELQELENEGVFKGKLSTLEALQLWADRPILLRTCQFGKHKGQPWSEVPRGYLGWALDNMKDLDSDTLHTLRHYYKANA
jgi:exodeoxyribonuclease X